jgi:putative Mg2+ transporter-C (MgtC) family protein
MSLSEWEIIGRLLLAAALGASIGVEREIDGQDAGFRTHLILALGAALFGVISVGAWEGFIDSRNPTVSVDPSRVASYVAAGIGFLGGGAILKHAGGVKGLTTASSLWIAAAVGLAAGLGLWAAALTATVIGLLSLAALRPVSSMVRRAGRRKNDTLTVVLQRGAAISAVLQLLESRGLMPTQVRAGPGHDGRVEVVLHYDESDSALLGDLSAGVAQLDDVAEVYIGRSERAKRS